MNRLIYLSVLIVAVMSLSGCIGNEGLKPNKITKFDYAPKFYDVHPKSILVLPAVNTTTAADAVDYFRYTITKPLAEQGYYVFPVHLVDMLFKNENLPDSELVRNIPINKLREIFNADSILYVDILTWDTEYAVMGSSVDVGIGFSLIDAVSEDEIWQGNIYGQSSVSTFTGDPIRLLVGMVDAAINAGVDYTDIAEKNNNIAVGNFPCGYYSRCYRKDKNIEMDIFEYSHRSLDPSIEQGALRLPEHFISGQFGFSAIEVPKGVIKLNNNNKSNNNKHIINAAYLTHSGFEDYYYYRIVNGKRYLRHRFFLYENNSPYLIADNKKVFVSIGDDGKFQYTFKKGAGSLSDDYYLMNIDRVVRLSSIK